MAEWVTKTSKGASEPEPAARLTQAIRNRVQEHGQTVPGAFQWYVDDLVIDCDAGEFWKVVEQALAAQERVKGDPY